jgi:predicted nucleic acid-binding protein
MLRDIQRVGLPGCSAISVIEVQLGVKTKDEEEKTSHFLDSLNVFDINLEIANRAARLIRDHKAKGLTIDIPDAIIASTCILHNLILVTYNRKHYPIAELKFHPLPPNKP